MKKIFKKGIAILLCLTLILNYSFSALADENVESSQQETTYAETIENNGVTENIEESESEEELEEETEESLDEPLEDTEEPEEDIVDEPEEEIFEDIPEEVEDELEEVEVSSPSEITDEENEEEEDDIPIDMVEEPEEDLPEETEEPTIFGSVASPSEVEEEIETEPEIEEEINEASPSELAMDMPMMLGAPMFGAGLTYALNDNWHNAAGFINGTEKTEGDITSITIQKGGTTPSGTEFTADTGTNLKGYYTGNDIILYTPNADDVIKLNTNFMSFSSLVSINAEEFDVSDRTSLDNMFQGCSVLTSLNLNTWDTTNITSMKSVFNNCKALATLDISNFDTTNVTDMRNMFYGCWVLADLSDVSSFVTSSVTNMGSMFGECKAITSLDLSSWDTSSLTGSTNPYGPPDGTAAMFADCISLATLDISNFDTSGVKKMHNMFKNCSSLTSLDLTSFDTSQVFTMQSMFLDCAGLTTITVSDDFVVTAITNLGDGMNMFMGCTSLVGGKGTPYSPSYVGKEYAHIDDAPSNPGYFTDGSAPTNECKIDTTEYATLEDAIAVADNQTITMLSDIVVSESRPITFTTGKTMTIDFNGHKVKNEYTTDGGTAIFLVVNANLTVKNLKYYTEETNSYENTLFAVAPDGTLTLDNMESLSTDFVKDTIISNMGGSATVIGGDITSQITSTEGMFLNASGGTLTIKGNGSYNSSTGSTNGVVTSGMSFNDETTENGNIVIENGTFIGNAGIAVNGKGNITIEDGNFNTQGVFMIMESGIKSEITIEDITANCSAAFMASYTLENKVDFQNGKVIYPPGWFSIDIETGNPNQEAIISNGKFGPSDGTTDIHDEIENLMATGATLTALSGDPDGYTYKVETPPPVCKIGTIKYTSLEAAITAATSGQTITLLSDITYTVGPNFVIDGKTVTIDFDGHSLTTDIGSSSSSSGRDIFTVTNTGNLTVKNGETVCICTYGNLNPFKTIGANSKLTLIDMTQATKLSGFLTMNGGTATINGGTFGTSGSSQQITLKLSNNATLNLVNNPQFYFQSNLFVLGNDATDPDTLVANVKIDSGTFNSYNNGSAIIYASGKSNVTINGGTYITTGTNTTSTPIFINTYGYKSNITINNFTSNSGQVFRSNCPNISEFALKINNGHYKYIKGKFALDNDGTSKPNVKLNGGYFGPDTADDDALAELTSLCVSGKNIETLESSDPEYANGYRYKIAADSPSPTPTPTPYHGGGSSGGGGGGAGIPRYDQEGNILGPSGIQNYTYDGSNAPNLTGTINVSNWNYSISQAQTANIHYAQNIDSFVYGDNSPVVTDWVGVSMENTSKLVWYRTNANGQILRNQFIQIGTNIYYLDNNGIMVTGQHTINGKVYNFETAVGATEGRFLY